MGKGGYLGGSSITGFGASRISDGGKYGKLSQHKNRVRETILKIKKAEKQQHNKRRRAKLSEESQVAEVVAKSKSGLAIALEEALADKGSET